MKLAKYIKGNCTRPSRYDTLATGAPDPWHVHAPVLSKGTLDMPEDGQCRFRFGGSDFFLTATPAELRHMADRAEKYIAEFQE